MKSDRASLAAALLAFAALSYLFFPESIDDAYITLRFSRNLLEGHGPVFNPGERVEGYSNFLWMALLAAFGRAGVPMELAMKLLGFAAGAAALALVGRMAAAWFRSRAAIAAAVLLLGNSSFFALWAVDGLETVFYTMLLVLLARELARDEPSAFLVGTLAALATLTRPEGALFALISVGFLAGRNGLRSGAAAFAPVALAGFGYEIFRLLYFGELASNVARVKMHPGIDEAARGLRYLFSYNSASGFLVLPAAFAGAALGRRIPALFLLAQIFFILLSGGDFMFGYRFVVPAMPFVALLAAGAVELLERRFHRRVAFGILALLVVTQGVAQFAALPRKHLGLDNLSHRSGAHFEIARFLASRTQAADSVALSEVGIIPYYLSARVVDYLGLVSPIDSVAPDRNSVDTGYVFSTRPKFVVLSFIETQDGSIEPRLPMDADVRDSLEFRERYEPVASFDLPRNESFLDEIYYRHSPRARRIFFAVFERTR